MITGTRGSGEHVLERGQESDTLGSMLTVEIEDNVQGLLAGNVCARGLSIGPSSAELRMACGEITSRVLRDGMGGGEPRRDAIRQLLRAGGFKPAGRNKPAQEYLLRTVSESRELPMILNAVDWLNAISLASGFPISLLSAARLGDRPLVRYGQKGETFVFNRAGQELDLEGLICVCAVDAAGSTPIGTPIKDSMMGKIGESDRDVAVFVYAPSVAVDRDELMDWCKKLATGFVQYCGAESADAAVEGPGSHATP